MRACVIALALTLLISGCGFQLRGKVDLPSNIDSVHVSGTKSDSDLAQKLRALLRGNDIPVVSSPTPSSLSIVLLDAEAERRTLSLDSRARAAEYLLSERVRFEIRGTGGKVLLEAQDLEERRVMSNDPDNVVGKNEEEQLLRENMQESLAAQIARQLRQLKPAPSASS